MRKKILYIFLFLVLSLSSFGTGMLMAELKVRKARAGNNGNSSAIIVKNNISSDEVIEEEKLEENAVDPAEKDSQDNIENVKPADPPDAVFSFAILGDTQAFDPGSSSGSFRRAAASIQKLNVDLVLSTGDLVSSCDGKSGCESKLNSWKNIMGPLSSKTYVVMGNHDRTGKDSADALWQKVFNLPANGPSGFSELTYSFDYGNAHFVALDSDKPEEHIINETQRAWLEKDLAGNKKELTFVFFHEPVFPVSSKIDESLDVKKSDRDALWRIFDKYDVTAVFSGHEHLNSRRKINATVFPGDQHEIYQFITGNTDAFDHDAPKPGMAEYFYKGKDFEVVSVDGKKITMKVYSVDGNLLNSFTFSK